MTLPPLPRVMDGLLGPIPVRRARDLRAEDGTPVGGLWYEERRVATVRLRDLRASMATMARRR